MAGLEDRFDAPTRFADAGDRLHELVTAETGLDDFGPDDYLEGLEVLLLSLDYDPHFSERGRRIIWGECYQALAARAHAAPAPGDMGHHPRVSQCGGTPAGADDRQAGNAGDARHGGG